MKLPNSISQGESKISMTYYQLLYLIPVTLEPDEIEKIQNSVRDTLSQNEAKIIKEFEPEKKRLSYTIKQVRHGIYIKIHFNAAQDKISPIRKNLQLTANLVRFILTKEKEITKKIKPKRKPLFPKPEDQEAAQVTLAEPDTQAPAKKPKINMDELDKKLDEILDN